MTSRTVALVPLRGGSKGIPGKNIKPIGGRPLAAWTLEAALATPGIDEVYVSTDSRDIATTVRGVSNRIQVIDRPAEFASDTASTEQVMLHFASVVPFDRLVTIQATSPLLTHDDLQQALDKFDQEGNDSMLSGVVQKRFFWKLDGTPLNYDPLKRPRRQDWDGSLVENGAFYITRRSILERHSCRLGGKIGVYAMPEDTYVEIDDLRDWEIVDRLLREKNLGQVHDRLADVRLLMVDVDGTLTDAGMYYDSRGEALKKFNTRDAAGLRMLADDGVQIVIVTREDSQIAAARAKKLQFPFRIGVKDKRQAIDALAVEYSTPHHQIAVIGDDVYDLPAMAVAGVSVCPQDAVPAVKAVAQYCMMSAGGHGAVREFCEMVMVEREGKRSRVKK